MGKDQTVGILGEVIDPKYKSTAWDRWTAQKIYFKAITGIVNNLRNSLLATGITSLQLTKLQWLDDWIFCLHKWLMSSLLLKFRIVYLKVRDMTVHEVHSLREHFHTKKGKANEELSFTDLAPRSSFAVTRFYALTQTFQANSLGLAMSLEGHWVSHTKLTSFPCSLTVPVVSSTTVFEAIWESHRMQKLWNMDAWRKTARPGKSDSDQDQTGGEGPSWRSKLNVREV